MPSIYIETTIVGYLASRASKEVIVLARQQLTREWWNEQSGKYELYVSQLVLDEAGTGDPIAVQERMVFLDGLSLLDILHPDVATVANRLLDENLLPQKAAADARHVAVAAVFGVNYLLTWNCKHIANAETLPRIYCTLRNLGFEPPLVVTPEEFSGNG